MTTTRGGNEKQRKDVLNFFTSLFTGYEAEEGSEFWSWLANAICDLYPEEHMNLIQEAYLRGLIYSGIISEKDFQYTLKVGRDRVLNNLKKTKDNKYSK